MWTVTPLPESVCAEHAELQDYGFWRKLNDGQWEHISFCHPNVQNFIGAYKSDVENLLDQAFPRPK